MTHFMLVQMCFTFLVDNDLFRLRLKLSENSQLTREEFEEVEQNF